MKTLNVVTRGKYHSDNVKDWITPCYPDWFKNLRANKDIHQNDGTTTRGCPSFIHLFKNSYCLRCPMDISVMFFEDGTFDYSHAQATGSVNHQLDFVNIGSFDLISKMGTEFSHTTNLKFDFRVKFIPSEPMRCLFLDPQYHTNEAKSPFTVMNGILPLYPDLYSALGLNLMISRDDQRVNEWIYVKPGTPLAYLYFPEGKPNLVSEWMDEENFNQHEYVRKHFSSDFLKKESMKDDSVLRGVPWKDE